MLETLFIKNFTENGELYLESLAATLQMVVSALIIAAILGFLIGVLLVITREGHLSENAKVFQFLNVVVNAMRSMPFIILMVAIMPLTKVMAGTTIGVQGAIVPLVAFSAPFIARLTESALLEVDPGVIEAFKAMGASRRQIILSVMLKEALPGLILALTVATIGLVGATAMAGVVGAGGLGDLALRYGYQRWNPEVMFGCVFIIWGMVQGIQSIGNYLSKSLRRK
ncbi:D-methionine transport system permease protein MetI [Sporomusa silvacetica DSM 10669]|uniref:D-methionine transport system permease protein MetI n=1 Tax=Sporomusa silvacetica DSM 10669 TaxID=1123289 RepID=A0ABZ3IH53_9FIRM|nr:methionine ABC transporter permease [Sporomusa silvacetica]OZC14837.1 D-methionine transport system permease protein MetI [Sporomusa silvacetica DSM 10669]